MELLCAIVIGIPVCHFTLNTHTDLIQPIGWGPIQLKHWIQLTPSTPATPVAHFRIRKIMPYKSKKYLNVLEKYLENEVLLKCT